MEPTTPGGRPEGIPADAPADVQEAGVDTENAGYAATATGATAAQAAGTQAQPAPQMGWAPVAAPPQRPPNDHKTVTLPLWSVIAAAIVAFFLVLIAAVGAFTAVSGPSFGGRLRPGYMNGRDFGPRFNNGGPGFANPGNGGNGPGYGYGYGPGRRGQVPATTTPGQPTTTTPPSTAPTS